MKYSTVSGIIFVTQQQSNFHLLPNCGSLVLDLLLNAMFVMCKWLLNATFVECKWLLNAKIVVRKWLLNSTFVVLLACPLVVQYIRALYNALNTVL